MIDQEVIERVLSSVAIEDVIGKDIELKKKGVNYAGCCPFHNEKTPSFIVSPVKGIFKCYGCGEGGNVISWMMKYHHLTFPEAIEKLADTYNIPFEKKTYTPAELEANAKRESLLIANEAANKYFISQLAVNQRALEYVKTRWKEDTIKEQEIGYAPAGWTALVDYLVSKQYNPKILEDVGVAKFNEERDRYQDVFVDRITIPIRNKNGQIIGFTARVIGPKVGMAKFINTKETPLFKKKYNLFGIYHAQREAYKNNQLVLVEGAPDVIRLQEIGVLNSVAPLGTALTDEQIALMKRYTKRVLLIPDQDDAGIKAVRENGVKLVNAGFEVTIMNLEGGKDADEVLTDKEKYKHNLENNTQDYIFWLAKKLLDENSNSQVETVASIRHICNMLANMNEGVRELYIQELSKVHKPRKIWTSTMAESLNTLKSEKEQKKSEEEGGEKGERYRFRVQNNCYFGSNNKGVEIQWSNFTMKPLALIIGVSMAKRLFLITNKIGEAKTVEMKQEELVSLSKFRIKTEGLGYFIWEAGESELHQLKDYLYRKTPTCTEITQLGWQQRYGFFAWGNGGFVNDEFIPTNDIGILTINDEHYYLPAFSKVFQHEHTLFQFERQFAYHKANGISLHDYAEKYIGVFGDNAKICLCFLIATIFRDIVFNWQQSFPILNIFGPKATGKTEAATCLSSFFAPGAIIPNITSATRPALGEEVARVSGAIVHIDEYKNNIDQSYVEFLKGLWGGTGRTRMNMDKDKKSETTPVDSGIVLTGQEMPTADNALFSRLIFLSCNKSEFSKEERDKFNELKVINNRGMPHLVNEILRHRRRFLTTFPQELKSTYELMGQRLIGEIIEDRTLKNWVSVIAAFKTLENVLNLPFTFSEILDIAAKGILNQHSKTKENNEVSSFWIVFETLVRNKDAVEKVDYKIKTLTGVQNLKERRIEFNGKTRHLLLHFNNTITRYQKESRATGSKTIPRDSLRYYLENSPEFIGTKKSERFMRVYDKNTSSVRDVDIQTPEVISQCMVFDYNKIEENYNISINEVFLTKELEEEDVKPIKRPEIQTKIPY